MRQNRARLPSPDALDAAWRIHAAQADWTGKVDAKAAFAFSLESASIATVVALSASGHLYADVAGWFELLTYWLGLALLMAAAVFAVMVVTPRLRTKQVKAESPSNHLYFGHARHWSAKDLEASLRSTDLLPQLSRQIVTMADIAWRKHRHVQASMSLAVVGGALLLVCGLVNNR